MPSLYRPPRTLLRATTSRLDARPGVRVGAPPRVQVPAQARAGRFLRDDLDAEQLDVALGSGVFEIRDAALDRAALDQLLAAGNAAIPARVRSARVGRLRVTVPWHSLGAKPVEVDVGGVRLALAPDDGTPPGRDPRDDDDDDDGIDGNDGAANPASTRPASTPARSPPPTPAPSSASDLVAGALARVLRGVRVRVEDAAVRLDAPGRASARLRVDAATYDGPADEDDERRRKRGDAGDADGRTRGADENETAVTDETVLVVEGFALETAAFGAAEEEAEKEEAAAAEASRWRVVVGAGARPPRPPGRRRWRASPPPRVRIPRTVRNVRGAW